MTIPCICRWFGGLVEDIKLKSRHYASDFRDGFALQSVASVVFLYFATLTPVVAFGAVLGDHTANHMVCRLDFLFETCVILTSKHLPCWSIISAHTFDGSVYATFSGAQFSRNRKDRSSCCFPAVIYKRM